jgi:heme A synthase
MTIRVLWRGRCKDGSEILLAPSESKDQAFRNLVLITLVFTFGLITLGGVVRATGSGLGCPDWPTCIQLDNRDAYIEVSHRLVAAVVGLLVLVVSIFAWRTYRKRPWIFIPTNITFILLVGQIVLGGITVLTELPRWAVMAHLVQAEAMIAVLLVVYVASRSSGDISFSTEQTSSLGRFPLFTLATAVAVFALLITGSYVANTAGATYACGDSWPLCKGELFPSEGLTPFHMGHRMASLAVGALVATTLLMAWRIKQLYPQIWAAAGILGLLFSLQVVAGAANQWLAFPVVGLVLHLSLATGVWMGTTLLVILALSCNGFLMEQKVIETHQTNSDLPKSPASQHGMMSALADRI